MGGTYELWGEETELFPDWKAINCLQYYFILVSYINHEKFFGFSEYQKRMFEFQTNQHLHIYDQLPWSSSWSLSTCTHRKKNYRYQLRNKKMIAF